MIKLFSPRIILACLFISTLMFAFAGCSTTTNIVRDMKNHSRNQFISIDQFNSDMSHRTILLNMTDGKVFQVEGVLISGDSLYFRDTLNHGQECISMQSIKSIQWKDRLGGALDGAVLIGTPVILGGVIAVEFSSDHRAADAIIASAGIIGVSVWVYSMIGHTQYYVFPQDTVQAYHDRE
jgi:hypothetical protein